MNRLGTVLSIVFVAILAPLPAQCELQWQGRSGAPGLHPVETVYDSARWDPDGAGPLGPRIVVSGYFEVAGDRRALNLAAWDPTSGTWESFGGGIEGRVDEAVGLPNGDLVAAGEFPAVGAVPVHNIARWDGTAWHALGAGIEGTVNAMVALPNGDLVVAGRVSSAGGLPANYIARWDGVAWTTMAGGMNGPVWALAVSPAGELHAGGIFTLAGGQPVEGLARWTGSTWVGIPSGGWTVPSQLEFAPNGDLYAVRLSVTSEQHVLRWDGSTWVSLGRLYPSVLALRVDPSGVLWVGGLLSQVAVTPIAALVRHVGGVWQPVGGFAVSDSVRGIEVLPGGDVVVVGSFTSVGSVVASGAARYDGAEWNALSVGTQGTTVAALAQLDDGKLAAGGRFGMIGGAAATNLAIHDGSIWQAHPIGWGGQVSAIGECQGQLVVAGEQNGAAVGMYAGRWDGVAWQSLGSLGGPVLTMCRLANGQLLIGGDLHVVNGQATTGLALWTGTTLLPFAVAPPFGPQLVRSILEMPGGDLVVAGYFTWSTGQGIVQHLARWNGAQWSPLGGAPNDTVWSVLRCANGDLVAGGDFTTIGGVPLARLARWNGTAWSACGSGFDGSVRRVVELPNGDLLAAGEFRHAGGIAAAGLARWDGVAWSPVDGGVDGRVESMVLRPEGDVVFGGRFAVANGEAAMLHATLAPGCRATTTSYGAGCSGSNGGLALAAATRPWVGSTWSGVGEGLVPGSLAASLFGYSNPNLPLALLTPLAGAGCQLLADNEAWFLHVATGSTLTTQLALPNLPLFAGIDLFHQVLALELDTGGMPLQLTASNGLRLRLGTL